nr:MAG TPA: YopX protein [Siphoviridae sp. ctSIv21]
MIPKFRAWLKKKQEMDNEVDQINWFNGELDFIGDGITYMVKADDLVLMQSTGLFDKNGQEIFEGDVLEIQGIKMIVKLGSYKYLETSKNNGHMLGVLYDVLGFYVECINVADPDNISPFEPETLKNSQIIGNVYQNPDLLEADHDRD